MTAVAAATVSTTPELSNAVTQQRSALLRVPLEAPPAWYASLSTLEQAAQRDALRALRSTRGVEWVAPLARTLPPDPVTGRVDREVLLRRHRATGTRCVTRLAAPGAYAALPAWRSREHWLVAAEAAVARRPELLREHHIERDAWRRWCRTISLYADPRTGRRCIVARRTLVEVSQLSLSTCHRARRLATELGLYTVVLEGRRLTFEECVDARGRGCPQTGFANEVALAVPRAADLWKSASPAGSSVGHGTPTRGRRFGHFQSPVSPTAFGRSARTNAAPSARQHPRRESGGRRGRYRHSPAALALAVQARETIPWLRDEQVGRLAPALRRFATARQPWTAADLVAAIDTVNARLGWMSLTADRIRTRPSAVLASYLRDLDPDADHPRHDPGPSLPPLCGDCDHRYLNNADGTVTPCPACHPAGITAVTLQDAPGAPGSPQSGTGGPTLADSALRTAPGASPAPEES